MHVKGLVFINSSVLKVHKIFILRYYIILINLEAFFYIVVWIFHSFPEIFLPWFYSNNWCSKIFKHIIHNCFSGIRKLVSRFSLILSVSLHVPKYMCSPCPAKIVQLVPQISTYSFSLASCTCAFWPDVEYLSCGPGLERGLKKIWVV